MAVARFMLPLLLVLACLPGAGQAQPAPDGLEKGRAAFEAGDLDAAREALEHVRRDDPQRPEAAYYLARLYLKPEYLDVGRAKKAIAEALKHRKEEVRYLEVDLWIRQFHGSAFLPIYQFVKRKRRAERLLRLDPDNRVAHFVLGVMHAERFDARYDGVAISQISLMRAHLSQEEAFLNQVSGLMDADLVRTDTGAVVVFTDRNFSNRRVPATTERDEALKDYAAALDHLWKAQAADPAWTAVYTRLMQLYARRRHYADALPVVEAMQRYLPGDAQTWLYSGYVAHRTGREAAARDDFDRALALMPARQRRAYRDVGPFLEEGPPDDILAAAQAFWGRRDPRYLTPENERLLEHYSRMVYADLRFGAMEEGRHGWETEPGQVIVRYGEPPAEARFSSASDRYALFHYGDIEFRFMDLVKAGRYYFYSPSATAFQGPSNKSTLWEHDYAIKGPETFRRIPERYDPPGTRVRFPYVVNRFRGAEGETTLVVVYDLAPTLDEVEDGIEAGVFVVDSLGRVLVRDVKRIPGPGEDSVGVAVQALSVQPGAYQLSVEFDAGGAPPVFGVERRSLNVPAIGDVGPAISDVMLAHAVEEAGGVAPRPGQWIREGLLIDPAPSDAFVRTTPVYLYFEAYDLALDPTGESRYEVEAVLLKGDDEHNLEKRIREAFSRREGVSARFEGTGREQHTGQYLVLDVHREDAGAYVLAVRVVDRVAGRTVAAHRSLVLR